jgi:hypothetical protein
MSVRGNRTAVGVRTATSGDAVLIKRKKARRYVASEPSVRVIKKKRYVTYPESPRAIIVKKRRPGIAVESEGSTRATIRSRTTTTVRGSNKPGESGTGVGSGQGTGGAGTRQTAPGGGQSGSDSTGRSGGAGTGAVPGAR